MSRASAIAVNPRLHEPHGKPCRRCGSTVRYKNKTRKCVACFRAAVTKSHATLGRKTKPLVHFPERTKLDLGNGNVIHGMPCPACGKHNSRVSDSTPTETAVIRTRRCVPCGHKFPTWEIAEQPEAAVRRILKERHEAAARKHKQLAVR